MSKADDLVLKDRKLWENTKDLAWQEPPSPRAFMGSCVFGAGLFIYGGIDSFPCAKVESDWHCFDFGLGCWVRVYAKELVNTATGVRLIPLQKHRKMHSLTAAIDPDMPALRSRLPWIQHSSGLYMFGGKDETGSLNSDLCLVKPNYLENEELISATGQYKRKVVPAVHLTVEVLNTQGRGPSARMQHAACYVHSK